MFWGTVRGTLARLGLLATRPPGQTAVAWTLSGRAVKHWRGGEAVFPSLPLNAVDPQGVVGAAAGPASGGGQAEVGAAAVVH